MDFEIVLKLLNDAMLMEFERPLNDAELALFKGAWQGLTYEAIADQSGYATSYLTRMVGPTFWKNLSQALGVKVSKKSFRAILEQRYDESLSPQNHSSSLPSTSNKGNVAPQINAPITIDWGEAPDIPEFFGRESELATLNQWILTAEPSCKIAAILGMGGIGKTTLTAQFIETVIQSGESPFSHIIWRSLRHAPPIADLLTALISLLSDQEESQSTPERLLYWLRKQRCLLILDNLESLLSPGHLVGEFLSTHEQYGSLLRLLAESRHQSCVIITSREKPSIVSTFESESGAIRSIRLLGSLAASQALLEHKKLIGTDIEKRQLCEFYDCSPLALKIVSASIHSLFSGNLSAFLAEETMVFNGLRKLLDQQFERLSDIEKTIMYWIAINREWVSIQVLIGDIVPVIDRSTLLESLESLLNRCLVEQRNGRYTQQPVVMEYISDRLIQKIVEEITTQTLSKFYRYALVKATVSNYIYSAQVQLLLGKVTQYLKEHVTSTSELQARLKQVLDTCRSQSFSFFDYGVGNLINLCFHLQISLSSFDFRQTHIRQVNFQGKQLGPINLSQANFRDCHFTQNFGAIFALDFNHGSRQIAMGDTSGLVQIWAVSQSHNPLGSLTQPLLSLKGHISWIYSLSWHPKGHQLISASFNGIIILWDTTTGRCIHKIRAHSQPIWCVQWNPQGTFFASCSTDSSIKIWQPGEIDCYATLEGHENTVWSLTWSPDGNLLASGSDDHTIRIWNVSQAQCIQTFTVPNSWVRAVAWHPQAKLIASSSSDQIIRLWSIDTGSCIQTFEGHRSWIYSLAWHPDGQILASASDDCTVRLWNRSDGRCLRTLTGHRESVWTLTWSPDGQLLASGGYDQTICLWNPQAGHYLSILQGYVNWIRRIDWSPDGIYLISSSTDRTARIWNPATGHCIQQFKGHRGWLLSVAWHPQQSKVASSSTDNLIKIWDTDTGHCLKTLSGHQSWIWDIAWSPDGQTLISASSTNDLTLRIWDLQADQCNTIQSGHDSWIWQLSWKPDGQQFATASVDRTIKIWDVQSGSLIKTLRGQNLLALTVAWNPDGQSLATCGVDGSVQIWDIESATCTHCFQSLHGPVWSVAWNQNGTRLVSGHQDGTATLWETETGECLNSLKGHHQLVFSVAWHPAGKVIATSSRDGTIRYWNPQTGACLGVMQSDRPYEGMNITDVQGLTDAQQSTLMTLGACCDDVSQREIVVPG